MTTPSVATLVHESLGERVYKSLRGLILNQGHPPGSKLNVEQLCRNLGVSHRFRSLDLPERLTSSVAEHRAIFAAVAAGDADRAEHLSRAHADHVLADALEFTGGAEPSPDSVRADAAPSAGPRGRR